MFYRKGDGCLLKRREEREREGEGYKRRRLNMVNMYCVCVASDIIRGRKGVR